MTDLTADAVLTLAYLRAAKAEIKRQHERIDQLVKDARFEGATWDQIAEACGITKQAAWERFR